uniref:AAA+ ATPase domain-containing protein n=1 Tax=Opuntia streptacantha TaxID=393608 RepID=A0A7C9EDZ9_OPUST
MALVSDVVTGFVSESTNSLLKAIIGRIRQEINLAWGFKADLRDLERQLKRLDAILCGVQNQTRFALNNPLLDDWLKQIKQVAYQAEDVIDDYSYELLKRKIALRNQPQRLRRFKTNIRFFFSLSSNPAVFRFQIAHKVKSLRESINQIYNEADKQGISPAEVAGGPGGRSSAYPDDQHDHNVTAMSLQRQVPYNEVLIKRNGAEDRVVRCLREASDSHKHLSLVGICGMAGVGKTTLCESIFNTMEIKEEFDQRIWICVSHDFDFKQLLSHMIGKIGDEQPSSMRDLHTLKERLEEKMQRKKFLLVLDDIWDTFGQYWEVLRGCLQNVGALKGNTILATSRLKDTLEKLDVSCILPLENLSKEESWSLFKQCVGENNLSIVPRQI